MEVKPEIGCLGTEHWWISEDDFGAYAASVLKRYSNRYLRRYVDAPHSLRQKQHRLLLHIIPVSLQAGLFPFIGFWILGITITTVIILTTTVTTICHSTQTPWWMLYWLLAGANLAAWSTMLIQVCDWKVSNNESNSVLRIPTKVLNCVWFKCIVYKAWWCVFFCNE